MKNTFYILSLFLALLLLTVGCGNRMSINIGNSGSLPEDSAAQPEFAEEKVMKADEKRDVVSDDLDFGCEDQIPMQKQSQKQKLLK